jgi:signal transduction histidine kinase
MNLVDLGPSVSDNNEECRPTIILPSRESSDRDGDQRPPPRPAFPPPGSALEHEPGHQPPPEPDRVRRSDEDSDRDEDPRSRSGWRRGRGGDGRGPFGRPPWMSEAEYTEVIQKQGVHSFVILLSTAALRSTVQQDLWMRTIISALAGVSAIGLGLAWRNIGRSSELELRLVRAREQNTHLRQLNLAAAGLAHETRNPLNIVRGLAQMISRTQDAPPEIRRKSREIIDETDRVTAQLNEFINYSRPREVRRSPVPLGPVTAEVARALTYDLDEKSIGLQIQQPLPAIEADEQLLRQTLFNLLLNAVQAVERGGQIEIALHKTGSNEACLEIRDNGPGVPSGQSTEIFKPYFTTHQKGTGLGLAVVEQIVRAHGWDIECLPNDPRGAVFRISHLKLCPSA